jgi:hypothetical protein
MIADYCISFHLWVHVNLDVRNLFVSPILEVEITYILAVSGDGRIDCY